MFAFIRIIQWPSVRVVVQLIQYYEVHPTREVYSRAANLVKAVLAVIFSKGRGIGFVTSSVKFLRDFLSFIACMSP
jgi:hypothetical protein